MLCDNALLTYFRRNLAAIGTLCTSPPKIYFPLAKSLFLGDRGEQTQLQLLPVTKIIFFFGTNLDPLIKYRNRT